jgi:hypothetical protein
MPCVRDGGGQTGIPWTDDAEAGAPGSLPHDGDQVSTPAPGDLESLRSFLSVHDHLPGSDPAIPPSTETLLYWFRDHGFLPEDVEPSDDELAGAAEVLEVLRARLAHDGHDPREAGVLNRAVRDGHLTVHFDRPARLEAAGQGVPGAVGRLLGVAFLAERDGGWDRLKFCANPACRTVFYDRSKNMSGRWCSMQTCGNRAKVRAFRERADGPRRRIVRRTKGKAGHTPKPRAKGRRTRRGSS